MGFFADMAPDAEIKEEIDSVGSTFGVVESGLYKLKIKAAYIKVATSKAVGVVLELETFDNAIISQTLWVKSGEKKGCKNFYTSKDGEKHYLPGYNQMNALCLLTVGKNLSEMETASQIIDIYDYAVKGNIPTEVDMLTELLEKEIIAGVIKQVVNKNALDINTNTYQPTAETREENEIDKFFRERDQLTVTEIKAEVKEATFYNKWYDRWGGKTRDKTVKVAESTTTAPSETPPQANLF